jgi:hypothetical protein
MADDWRLTVDFDEEHDGTQLTERLDARRFEHDERHRFGSRVVVSRDSGRVFFYADSEADARATEEVVREDLDTSGKPAEVTLERWHPVEQEWQDPAVPVPATPDEVDAEERRRMARETAESAASGKAEWEVRVELPDHEQAVLLADTLESEGVDVVRRHTLLLVGAANEDEAKELAERLEAEAPKGSTVHVQPGGEMVWEVTPQNPFVNVLGGLGG